MFSGKRNLCFVKFSISRKGMKLPLKRFFIIHSGMRSVNARKITVTFWNSDIRPVFPYLSDDICPMFFPFFVENRDALIKHLADRHIPPKVYWPVPPFVKVEDYPGAQYIYSHIMSVSCDERFNTDDMQKIVEAFENY